MSNELARESIHRARVRLLSKHPFYGYLACKLKLREWPEQPTMATDGEFLFYNSDFVNAMTKTQMEANIAHEVSHVYLKHPLRMEEVLGCRDLHRPDGVGEHECGLKIAQYATDLAINPRLKDANFDLFPGAAFPEQKYWDDSFEAHYKRIKKGAKSVTLNTGSGGCSGVQPMKNKSGKPMSAAERSRADADAQTNIMNAAHFARAAGKLPADIERMINDLRKPKVAWFDVLRRFMQATTKNDYRMLPPNRRYVHQGMYLPALRSEAVSDVLLIVDGSGSTYSVFPQFISEFASILLDVRPERLHVMVWDTRCTWRREFDSYSGETAHSLAAMQAEMGAGGGTVFTECFEYFEHEVGIRPNIAIVLTDMELYGDWPANPEYPVMWVATTDIVGPYGETVKIETD